MEKEGNQFNETDVYRVRRQTRLNQGLFLCKLIMKKHGTVQIEGMGECISLVTKFAQILSKNGFATMKMINSGTIDNQNGRGINPKMIIKLEKSADFDKLTEQIIVKS